MQRLTASLMACAVCACAQAESVARVQVDEYSAIDLCWQGSDGEIEAFIAIQTEDGLNYPFFVSVHCDVEVGGMPEGAGFLAFMKPIMLRDQSERLSRALDNQMIFEATTHTATPTVQLDAELYAFKGELAEGRLKTYVSYSISKISTIRKVGLTVGELAELTPEQRLKFWNDYVN